MICIEIETSYMDFESFKTKLGYYKGKWYTLSKNERNNLEENPFPALIFFDITYSSFLGEVNKKIVEGGHDKEIIQCFPFESIIDYAIRGGEKPVGEGYAIAALNWLGEQRFPVSARIRKSLERISRYSRNDRFNLSGAAKAILKGEIISKSMDWAI